MIHLERKMEQMMAYKIDDELSKMKDRQIQKILEEDPFVVSTKRL